MLMSIKTCYRFVFRYISTTWNRYESHYLLKGIADITALVNWVIYSPGLLSVLCTGSVPMPPAADIYSHDYFGKNFPTLIARFMGPTWGPSGSDRTQVGPMNFAIRVLFHFWQDWWPWPMDYLIKFWSWPWPFKVKYLICYIWGKHWSDCPGMKSEHINWKLGPNVAINFYLDHDLDFSGQIFPYNKTYQLNARPQMWTSISTLARDLACWRSHISFAKSQKKKLSNFHIPMRLSDAYIHQCSIPNLVQIMACRLFPGQTTRQTIQDTDDLGSHCPHYVWNNADIMSIRP